jgi:HTH-type transcriptional regulator/antitoxin HigA
VDAEGTQVAQDLERDADRFAGQTLISPEYQGQLEEVRSPDDAKVLADQLGVDVSIIVGRLQHEKLIPFSKWNDLIPRYRFHDDN